MNAYFTTDIPSPTGNLTVEAFADCRYEGEALVVGNTSVLVTDESGEPVSPDAAGIDWRGLPFERCQPPTENQLASFSAV